MDITILGIESSCDDTSAAVIRDRTLLSNVIASQAVHQKYGGVIPELASRAHQQNIVPVVDTALKEAGVTIDKIDAIAFTRGPRSAGDRFWWAYRSPKDSRSPTTFRWWRSIICRAHPLPLSGPARPTASAPRLSVPLPAGQRRTYPIVKVDGPLDMQIVGTRSTTRRAKRSTSAPKSWGCPIRAGR